MVYALLYLYMQFFFYYLSSQYLNIYLSQLFAFQVSFIYETKCIYTRAKFAVRAASILEFVTIQT